MSYNPSQKTAALLTRALDYVNSVPYRVGARWVFYQLLQDSSLSEKSDYKKLVGFLSPARKRMWGGWRPDTLVDESRSAQVRGSGFDAPQGWVESIAARQCVLDRWRGQPEYVEVWFEAAAMEQQFSFYVDENVPLLAFHGDISIPEKWKAAKRLMWRWKQLKAPIRVCYFGDLDPKGLEIPFSAERDVRLFMAYVLVFENRGEMNRDDLAQFVNRMQEEFTFVRMGLNDETIADDLIGQNNLDPNLMIPHFGQDQVGRYGIPENPERPGTYQWEGLDDDSAQDLIGQVNDLLDQDAFEDVKARESDATQRFQDHMEGFQI